MIRLVVRVAIVAAAALLLFTVVIPAAVAIGNLITPTGVTSYPWSVPGILSEALRGSPLPSSTLPVLVVLAVLVVVALLVVAGAAGHGLGPAGRASIVRMRAYVWWRSKPRRAPLTAKAAEPLGRIGWFGFFGMRWFTDMLEETRVLIAPSGAGKTVRLVVQLIFRAQGAVVSTSTKTDVIYLTAWIRKIRKPFSRVMAFDPENLVPWMPQVKWDIVAGCEVPEMAVKRAHAIIAARPLNDSHTTNAGFFAKAAATILQCLLHAAAVEGLSMREVMRWMNDFENDAPYDILRHNPRAVTAWEPLLKKYTRGKAEETISNTDMSASGILVAFTLDNMLDAVCPGPGDEVIDISRHHRTSDTLYLVCKGEESPSASIFTALVESMYVLASDDATRNGAIVPPLELVLDEFSNVCAIPSAPRVMSTGRGEGICPTLIVQDLTQLVTRYSDAIATTIVNNATELMIMGGLKDARYLDDLANLAGHHAKAHGGRGEHYITAEKIRTLWDGRALLFYRNQPFTVITLPAWWSTRHRRDYQAAQAWAKNQQAQHATQSESSHV